MIVRTPCVFNSVDRIYKKAVRFLLTLLQHMVCPYDQATSCSKLTFITLKCKNPLTTVTQCKTNFLHNILKK